MGPNVYKGTPGFALKIKNEGFPENKFKAFEKIGNYRFEKEF
jgi:hypothetical protein